MQNKFVVEQKPLMAILSSMQPICTKRTTLDTTTSIFFQVGHRELVLKGTDLEISLQASCQLKESDLDQTRTFLVSGRRIFDLVKELEGDIEFGIQDQQVVVKAGRVRLFISISFIDWNNHHLNWRNFRRQNKPFFITMAHDHRAD